MKLFKSVAVIICILFLFWIAASYADIVSNNLSPNPEYQDWNFFVITIK